MVLKFYSNLMSQPCRALYIFMKMNNIPFETQAVELGDLRSEEYKKMNPFSTMPVINDDGFILTESMVIMQYLAEKYNVAEHWYPRHNLLQRTRVDEYLHWQHVNARLQGVMLFQNLVLIPKLTGSPIDWKKVKNAQKRFAEVVEKMEKYFLKNGQPYLAGNEISIADLSAFCEFMQLDGCWQESLYTCNPVVNAWMERVKAKTQPYFDDAHQIIFGVRNAVSQEMKSKM